MIINKDSWKRVLFFAKKRIIMYNYHSLYLYTKNKMPEDNQIQPWFQPEVRADPHIQQNNLVQNQQTNQEVVQQNKVESSEQDLSQNSNLHSSWLIKVLCGLFFLLWIVLIWFWLYKLFQTFSDWHRYSQYATRLHYSIRDIFVTNWTFLFWPCWIWSILIWIRILSCNSKIYTKWLAKILSGVFLFIWITLIWLWIYECIQMLSNSFYSRHYSARDIVWKSWIFLAIILWFWFIFVWIFSYRTPNVHIYYHPSLLTKVLSGIYRFLWLSLILYGVWNFSLIWTNDLSFLNALYAWWVISLCWVWYFSIWRLLYCTKSIVHLWFSMLCALVVNVMFARILRTFTNSWYWSDIFWSFWVTIVLFTLIYFSILTIRWVIISRRFRKKWLINPKYLNQLTTKKTVWIFTTTVLISIVLICLVIVLLFSLW